MTNTVTPEQAQLGRVMWILKRGCEKSGLSLSPSGFKKLAESIREVMVEERMFFDTQQRVDDEASRIEQS